MSEQKYQHQSAICANCRRRLIPTEEYDADKNLVGVSYTHPRKLPGVECTNLVPILFDGDERQPDQVSVCDFCGTPGVTWDYPASDFPTPGDPTLIMTGTWASCDACHDDIEAQRWQQMAERWNQVNDVEQVFGWIAEIQHTRIYRRFQRNRLGPARKI